VDGIEVGHHNNFLTFVGSRESNVMGTQSRATSLAYFALLQDT